MISLTSLSRTLESWLLPLAQEGLFEPLDEAHSTPALRPRQNMGEKLFIPNLMESMKINGVELFHSESMYTHGFFYDAAMFREPRSGSAEYLG